MKIKIFEKFQKRKKSLLNKCIEGRMDRLLVTERVNHN